MVVMTLCERFIWHGLLPFLNSLMEPTFQLISFVFLRNLEYYLSVNHETYASSENLESVQNLQNARSSNVNETFNGVLITRILKTDSKI